MTVRAANRGCEAQRSSTTKLFHSAVRCQASGLLASPVGRLRGGGRDGAGHGSAGELCAEIADLERRIERQVANLEAEDATPSLSRRVGAWIADLEEAVEERRQHANALTAQAADDSLQLQIALQPQTRTIDVEVTLVADEQPDREGEASQVWSVPPAGLEPAHPAPEAGALSAELRGRAAA